MLNKLRKINTLLIQKYTKAQNDKKVKKLMLIDQMLKNDDCFFSISIEDAFQILKCMDFTTSEIKDVYAKLISPKS